MFKNPLARKAEPPQVGSIIVERSEGDPLQFDGVLHVESDGRLQLGYRPNDPYHVLYVYHVSGGGFAVVIQFWMDPSDSIIDGELVSSVDELDDFFCIQAADHFMQLGTAGGASAREEKELEQRVVARYDQQVRDVLLACGQNAACTDSAPATGRSPYGGWSQSAVAEGFVEGDDV